MKKNHDTEQISVSFTQRENAAILAGIEVGLRAPSVPEAVFIVIGDLGKRFNAAIRAVGAESYEYLQGDGKTFSVKLSAAELLILHATAQLGEKDAMHFALDTAAPHAPSCNCAQTVAAVVHGARSLLPKLETAFSKLTGDTVAHAESGIVSVATQKNAKRDIESLRKRYAVKTQRSLPAMSSLDLSSLGIESISDEDMNLFNDLLGNMDSTKGNA